MLDLIKPNWPAPFNIKAYCTTRKNGFSQPPYASFNLGDHCGDDPFNVKRNRTLLSKELNLPTEPSWLNQTHGTHAVDASRVTTSPVDADAAFSYQPKIVCSIMTADCLPLLICDRKASCVAAIHAGWRGLAAGVIEATLAKLSSPREDLLVWLGPAIGPQFFEVGADVLQQFVDKDATAINAFKPLAKDKWLADVYFLARLRLGNLGVTHHQIYGGDFCTYRDEELFFSYRRDKITGRMASLIWISE